MQQIAAVILTYNEAAHIEACIESLHWADVVLVFDSHSTDDTRTLAEGAGATVIAHPFENYGAQRNAALDAVRQKLGTGWVLFVDADERATPLLAQEVRGAIREPDGKAGWWVPRHNYIFGRLTLVAGWYPDYQLRLLRPDHAHYDPQRPVHEEVILDGEAGTLKNPLIHYNYETVQQFRAKQARYAEFEARTRHENGHRPRLWTPLTGALRQFWWRFITLKGYRGGLHGLRLSALMAYYEFRTWVRVRQLAAES